VRAPPGRQVFLRVEGAARQNTQRQVAPDAAILLFEPADECEYSLPHLAQREKDLARRARALARGAGLPQFLYWRTHLLATVGPDFPIELPDSDEDGCLFVLLEDRVGGICRVPQGNMPTGPLSVMVIELQPDPAAAPVFATFLLPDGGPAQLARIVLTPKDASAFKITRQADGQGRVYLQVSGTFSVAAKLSSGQELTGDDLVVAAGAPMVVKLRAR
jgi:hypothetical protein